MSLKAVHLVFVTALSGLALACSVLKARDYFSPAGQPRDLVMAIAALLGLVLVLIYGRYFLKKLKKVSYL